MPYFIINLRRSLEKSFGVQMNIFDPNMLISGDIIRNHSSLSSYRKGLPWDVFSDNVLHYDEALASKCNTFSEVHHDNHHSTKSTSRVPFCPNSMLDDSASGCQNALLNSLGSAVSGRGRLLQQFHSQRWLVHPSLDTSIRKKRSLVLSRYRFFPCRDANQNPHCTDHRKPGRYERGDARGDSPVPVPWGPGKSVAQGQNRAAENRSLPGLLCRRSLQSGKPAPGIGCAKSAGSTVFSRDCSSGSGRVYPQPRCKLRTISRKNLPKQKRDRECKTNRTAFRSTQSKKNGADRGVRALKALTCTLKQLSIDISPVALFPQPPLEQELIPEM